MTRKDYVAIAGLIRAEKARHRCENSTGKLPAMYDRAPYEAIERVQAGLADFFARGNKDFDRARFNAACEP